MKEIGYQGIRKGDLVIHAMDAFAGAVGVADSDGKGTPVYSVCSPVDDVNAYFYAFLVREMARSQWIVALAKGIRERSTDFRFEAFGNQVVPIPPKEEQAAIVRFLDHADRRIRRAIAAKQKLIKLLEEQKRAIIHRAVTRGLDPDVRLKPSGVEWLGDRPAHWNSLRLKFVASKIVDCLHATPKYSEAGRFLAIRTADIAPGVVRLATARRVGQDEYARWTQRLTPADGDVLYSREGERYGIAACVPEGVDLCISQRMMVFRIRSEHNATFVMWLLNSPQVYAQAGQDVMGATAPHVNVSTIRNYVIALPARSEQDSIVEYIDASTGGFAQSVAAAIREISLLREYRTRLIADVVTGKLDVREAAARLPDEVEDAEAGLDEEITEGGDGIEGEGEEADAEEIAA